MNLGSRRPREEPELNVVSLVDVVLLLLIFFPQLVMWPYRAFMGLPFQW